MGNAGRPRTINGYRQYGVRFSRRQVAKLQALCAALNLSPSGVIRKALNAFQTITKKTAFC
jgi:hypothetical protein